jgi:alpha-ketoglutarate-dependent taurine dioxygenase
MNLTNNLKNFKSINIDLEAVETVEIIIDEQQHNCPTVFKATEEQVLLNYWIVENRTLVYKHLYKSGAVLFRNFNMESIDSFREVVSNHGESIEYDLGAAKRDKVIDNIYISTFHPKEENLEMHNEMSYSSNWPRELMLFCELPSEIGGETPLCDGRTIWNMLSDDTKNKFMNLSIMYVRKLGGLFGGLSWQKVFDTNERKIAEEKCFENNIEFEWLENDIMLMKWVKSPIITHPVTQEVVWFNHCYFFNSITLNDEFRDIMSIKDIPYFCFYGDGSLIEHSVLLELKTAFEKTKKEFRWEQGDVLLIDNILLSHGRSSFKGNRKVLAAMIK